MISYERWNYTVTVIYLSKCNSKGAFLAHDYRNGIVVSRFSVTLLYQYMYFFTSDKESGVSSLS